MTKTSCATLDVQKGTANSRITAKPLSATCLPSILAMVDNKTNMSTPLLQIFRADKEMQDQMTLESKPGPPNPFQEQFLGLKKQCFR